MEDGKREEKRGVGSGRATATGARLAHSATVQWAREDASVTGPPKPRSSSPSTPVPPVFFALLSSPYTARSAPGDAAHSELHRVLSLRRVAASIALLTPGGAHEPAFLMSRSHSPVLYCNLAFQTVCPARPEPSSPCWHGDLLRDDYTSCRIWQLHVAVGCSQSPSPHSPQRPQGVSLPSLRRR